MLLQQEISEDQNPKGVGEDGFVSPDSAGFYKVQSNDALAAGDLAQSKSKRGRMVWWHQIPLAFTQCRARMEAIETEGLFGETRSYSLLHSGEQLCFHGMGVGIGKGIFSVDGCWFW